MARPVQVAYLAAAAALLISVAPASAVGHKRHHHPVVAPAAQALSVPAARDAWAYVPERACVDLSCPQYVMVGIGW